MPACTSSLRDGRDPEASPVPVNLYGIVYRPLGHWPKANRVHTYVCTYVLYVCTYIHAAVATFDANDTPRTTNPAPRQSMAQAGLHKNEPFHLATIANQRRCERSRACRKIT
jgi:hypothetical protein